MSTSVLLVLSALLIVAGAVSITAAAMGNPIRIGGTTIPGPDSAIERAVIAVVGAICVAAVVPVFLVGGTGANAKQTAVDLPVTPDPIPTVTTDPSPLTTPSPEPVAGPSTVTAAPGVPTVTAISVAGGPANGCTRTFTASVRISNGPVDVVYRTLVDGVRVGPTSRTKTISGAGLRTLDAIQVTATHSGLVTIRFDVIDPNPSLLSGTTTWTAPSSCTPVVQPPVVTTTTTPPPAVLPTLAVSLTVPAGYTGPCDTPPQFTMTGHITIGAGGSPSVNWTLKVDGTTTVGSGLATASVDPTSASFSLTAGDHTVDFDANGGATTTPAIAHDGGIIHVECTAV